MLHSTSPLTPIAMRVRNAQADAWLANCQMTSSHLVSGVSESSQLTVYSAPSSAWLFTVSWSQEHVTVAAYGSADPYRFSDLPSALCFLSGLLMSYVADLTPHSNFNASPPASRQLA